MEVANIWPRTSNAFSDVQFLTRSNVRDSPPRKVARLDGDARDKESVFSEHSLRRVRKTLTLKYETPLPVYKDDSSSIDLIRQAIRALLDNEKSIPFPNVSFNSIFDAVELAVSVYAKGPWIYNILTREIDRACVQGIAKRLSTGRNATWLSKLVMEWQWFEEQLGRLEALLTWLDRSQTSSSNTSTVRALGLKAFEQSIISGNIMIHDKMSPCIKEWATIERDQHKANLPLRSEIAIFIRMTQVLEVYHEEFHVPYIQHTREYYTKEAASFCSNPKNSPVDFVLHCIKRIAQEAQRCRDVLPEESAVIKHVTETALLDAHIEWLVDVGVNPLVDSEDIDTLRKMYDLLERVGALEALKSAFAKSVEVAVGRIVLFSVEREDEMIPMLLKFKSFVDNLLVAAFREEEKIQLEDKAAGSPRNSPNRSKARKIVAQRKRGRGVFGYAATDAFAKGFTKRHRKPAEMIAKAIDKAMRKGQQGQSDKQFDEKLDAILSLYQFTKDRDVFRTFYWRALSKRLLLQRSASDDFEKAVIKKLRDGYDPEFGKGEEMFKDLAVSKDLLVDYHEKYPIDAQVSIIVLQESHWPYSAKQRSDIDLPSEMLVSLERFSTLYTSKYKQKFLTWMHELGTASLIGRFNASEKEISVSLYQAIVLLLFNTSTKLKFTEVKQLTNMDDGHLRRTLQSLACGKKRVLRKMPAGKDVNDSDDFLYNAEFTDPSRKIHINSIQQKISAEESKATDEKVQEDRTYLLDAAIVRIMKSKKHLTSSNIVLETIQALKGHFYPDVKQIKKQIESLTEREYIKRDETHREMFHYVA